MEGGRAGACAAEAPLGELAGAACWETACSSSDESMQRGMIRLIYVRQEFRGLGIGSRLLETALDTLAESGLRDIYLSTPDMQMSSWLEQGGFKPAAVLWQREKN